jgi:hypothetical protein
MEIFTATNLAALILGLVVGHLLAKAFIRWQHRELMREHEAEDYDRKFREAYRLDAERDERPDA